MSIIRVNAADVLPGDLLIGTWPWMCISNKWGEDQRANMLPVVIWLTEAGKVVERVYSEDGTFVLMRNDGMDHVAADVAGQLEHVYRKRS